MKYLWQQEQLFFNAEDYFSCLLADMAQAQSSLILETYIFKQDATGLQVIEALKDAAQRGVAVRLLIDGLGSGRDAYQIMETLSRAGVEVRIFRPLPWHFSLHQRTTLKADGYTRFFNFFWRINKRDHRKLCVIDQKIAWVGSFNITQDHFGHGNNPWKDLAARVEDEKVKSLQQSFEDIWRRLEKGSRYRRVRNFFSNHSRRLRKSKNVHLLKLIHQAKQRVWITNAYFSPSLTLLKALKAADRRGVSVRIMVPQKSDIFLFPALTSTYYADLIKAGIRIYEYQGKILHEKSLLIDNIAIVGSTNLNYRSLFHDLELDVLLNQPDSIRDMEFKFIEEVQYSQEITSPKMQQYPRLLLLLGWFSRIIRYWL